MYIILAVTYKIYQFCRLISKAVNSRDIFPLYVLPGNYSHDLWIAHTILYLLSYRVNRCNVKRAQTIWISLQCLMALVPWVWTKAQMTDSWTPNASAACGISCGMLPRLEESRVMFMRLKLHFWLNG